MSQSLISRDYNGYYPRGSTFDLLAVEAPPLDLVAVGVGPQAVELVAVGPQAVELEAVGCPEILDPPALQVVAVRSPADHVVVGCPALDAPALQVVAVGPLPVELVAVGPQAVELGCYLVVLTHSSPVSSFETSFRLCYIIHHSWPVVCLCS